MRRGRGRERGRQARQSEEGEEEDEAGMGRKRGDGWNRVQKGALTISLHLIPSSPKQIPHVYTPVSPIHLTPPHSYPYITHPYILLLHYLTQYPHLSQFFLFLTFIPPYPILPYHSTNIYNLFKLFRRRDPAHKNQTANIYLIQLPET